MGRRRYSRRLSSSMHVNGFPTISLRGSYAQEEVQERDKKWTKKSVQMHRGLITAIVPRRTRSALVKRPHHSLVKEQSAQVAPPLSSNLSLSKKMKSIPSSSNHEDIEIEIAELLNGLRASLQNHDSSSLQKLEATDSPPLSSLPSIDADKKEMEDLGVSCALPASNSNAESVIIETEKLANMENPSLELPRISGGRGIGSSQCPKQDIVEDNLNSGVVGRGDAADGRSESKLEVDKDDCDSIRGTCDDVSRINVQHKFNIDLTASPPVSLFPIRNNLSMGEDGIKVEEVKVKVDLEKLNKHNDLLTNHELVEHDIIKDQTTTTSTNPKREETVQCSLMSLSKTISKRPSSLSLGYMPPLGTIVKTDKTTKLSTTPQHENFVMSQPRPNRCATHCYIARNIFMHQQCTKMNTLLPSTIGCSSMSDSKSNNVSQMHSAKSVVVGKQPHKQLSGMNQNVATKKKCAVTSDFNLAAFKSHGLSNPMELMQMKHRVLQQSPYPGSSANVVHQASGIKGTRQAGGVNNISSAILYDKFHNSVGGSLGTPTLSTIATPTGFSYPNLASNDAPYMTIVPNSGYPFPFTTPLGASAASKGVSHVQSTPMLNGSLYSSQIFHPLQYPQQHPYSQPLVQPSYLNANTSGVLSLSHKQSQGMQGNNNNIYSSTVQLHQSQKQHNSQSHPLKYETGMAGENALSAASGTTYSQKNVFGKKITIPDHPLTFSFKPSTTSINVGGSSGTFGDKKQQQQSFNEGHYHIPSKPYAKFQSMSDIPWQGYHVTNTSHATQQKMYPITKGNGGGNSSCSDDDKKATFGKPLTNMPTTLVFDNSSKNLNFVSSPMNGNWPSRSITSTATTKSLSRSSSASNSQQPPQTLHLQQQHGLLHQQHDATTRYKASSINIATTKILNTPPIDSQTQTECKGSNQGSQSKNLVTTLYSQVHNPSIITSTSPILQRFSQGQGGVIQGHNQMSFGGNYILSLPLQEQQLFSNNNQSLSTTVAGTQPSGSNLKTNS